MDSQQNQPAPETRLHFLDYWRIIRIRKAIIITVFLITAIIATAVTFILPASYSSTAEVKIEPDNTVDVSSLNPMTTTTPGYDPYFLQTELEILQESAVLDRVIDKLNLNSVWGKKYGMDTLKTTETRELLKRQMSLSPVRNTDLVDITVYDSDKNEAANIANAIAQSYRDYRLDRHKDLTANGIKSFEDQYQGEEDQIDAVQKNVDKLRQSLGIVDTDPNSFIPSSTLNQEQLQQYHEMMMEGQIRYIKLKEQLSELKALSPQQLVDTLPTIQAQPDAVLSGLLDKLNEAQQGLVTKTNDYSPANPDIIRMQALITELNEQISDRVSGIMVGLQNNLNTEKAALDALNVEVDSSIKKDQEEAVRGQPYWQEKRRLANMIDFHRILAAKIEQEKVDLAIPKTSLVEITRTGEPGKDPVRPNKPLNIALGLVFGLIMGIGLAFFIEYLDTSVKTIDDVERAFQAPVLGVIPQNVGYLIDEGPESRYAEAYRVLRTNILFSRKDEKLTTIVVVSAGAGEGKSTTTVNLATVFAQAGERVLVVDSDLRRPTLHKLLHVSNDIGLTNYLLKQNTLEQVIQMTPVPTLHFMASGKLPSSSMSILNSAQMKEMVAELKQRYDFVLFDSPPILGVSDASILASEMDMVIQVIQYRRYPQPMNLRAKQVIEKVGGTFIGIVLNNINMSQDESYYYYSGYYHDYYSSNNPKEQEAAVARNPEDPDDSIGIKQKY
ncbi:MAG TPA: polysaccharide biosynthesis tyrosine autokinase [Verrucomicrobiae bacterium]|nr:polysaccharide biosynthesis tyrosine autokinase [Verrucomicrobiae bacterium]